MNNPLSLYMGFMSTYINLVALAVLEMPIFCFVVERRGKLSGLHGAFINFLFGSNTYVSQNVVT